MRQQQALARQYWNEAGRLAKAYAAQQARKAWVATKRLVKKAVKTVARAAVSTAHWVAKHSKVITQVGLAVAAVALTVVNVAQLGLDPVTDAAEAADVGAPADIDALHQKITHLEQQAADLRLRLEERGDELSAARAANRELMTRLNQSAATR